MRKMGRNGKRTVLILAIAFMLLLFLAGIAAARYMKEESQSGVVELSLIHISVNRCNVWAEMKALCKTARVSPEKVFPHNLRHLFAVTYYRMQKDIVHLADILGHSNICLLYTS